MALDRARAALVAGDRGGAFSELLGLREVTGEEEAAPPVSLADARLGELLRARPQEEDACPTGIAKVDELWEGGVYPGNLALVAADTNTGKSMMLCYLATSAYFHNKRVLYFTYELTKTQVAERVLTALFECPKQELNPATIVDDLMKFRERKQIDKGSLVIDDGSAIHTVADLGRRLAEEDIDLVLLDSADDLQPSRNYTKAYEGFQEIYRQLRIDVCQGLEIPVWTSVQLNRDAVERAKVSLKHIGDAYAKAQRAHLILAMSQTPDERDFELGPLVKLHILKDTEHGSKGKWFRHLTLFGRGSRGWPGFSYYPEWEDLS
jgi:replicative DNA helicase